MVEVAMVEATIMVEELPAVNDPVSEKVAPGRVKIQLWPRSKIPGIICLLYTSPSPRDKRQSRMPSSA